MLLYHAPDVMSRMRLVGCNFEQARGTEISIAKPVESMSGARTTNANARLFGINVEYIVSA